MAPTNDPANDKYNPPGNLSQDFEKFRFDELELDDLFWQTNSNTENNPWRKLNQNQGFNLKSQSAHNFNSRTVVYQKV